MSGTNAHMVVRSYDEEADPGPTRVPHYLLVLSARTPDALQRKISDMVAYLESAEAHDLTRISYTLLEGRWHFRYRCAIVIQDRDDAIQVWRQVVKTPDASRPNLFQGEVPRGFTARRAIHELALNLLDRCRAHGEPSCLDHEQYQENLLALADLYCQGYDLPWDRLFPAGMRRMSLPTYPFAREHYWVAETAVRAGCGTAVAARHSHRSGRWHLDAAGLLERARHHPRGCAAREYPPSGHLLRSVPTRMASRPP